MRPKDDSVIMDFSVEAWEALIGADDLHEQFTEKELVVTSGSEAIPHSVLRSAHHRKDAWDMRRWYLKERALEFVIQLRRHLGRDWIVLLEDNHIHAHWSPMMPEIT